MFFELSLDGFWVFKGFSNLNGEQLGAHTLEYNDDDWFPAHVPGTVHTDLMANNIISDPFQDENEKDVAWVTEKEWWYRKQVDLPPEVPKKGVVELVFDGLDTFAAVWVNGIKVGEAYNMFTPWRFNIKTALREGKNVIAVRFKPIYKVALELERKYSGKYGCLHAENCSARPYVRKAQYSFGWDWGPTLPTAGIWRGARLVAYDKVKLEYLAALPVQVTEKKATIKIIADVNATTACCVDAKFVVEGFGQRIEQQVIKQIDAGHDSLGREVEIAEPKLWWPKGYGAQNLYDVSVELYSSGSFLEKATAKCGVRSVVLLQEPDEEGKCFIFVVNGLKVFCKGANWVPTDSFLPRVTLERYKLLLGLAVEAHINMLRVWGGGVYEDDVFYDLCDKLGIMIWQDFMYACAAYPEEEWFLQEAKREAGEVLRRLRGHPCIVVWCGNNEIQWQHFSLWRDRAQPLGLPIFNEILPEVLSRLDGTRPYQPSTPYGGEEPNSEAEGSRHNWVVWSKETDYPAYLEDKGRFLTEFGWQAPPSLKLLDEYLGTNLQVDSPVFLAHEKQIDGIRILKKLLSLHYPVPDDFRRFVLYAQLNQGEALKTAVTFWRSRMFKTSGCLIWQLNDCWPAVSWSLIDYGLNPKAAYFFVKRAFQPVIAPLIVRDGKVYGYIVNETAKELNLTFKFEVIRFNGELLYAERTTTVVSAYRSLLVFESALDKLPLTDDCVLLVKLEEDGVVLYEDLKTVVDPKDFRLPEQQIVVKLNKVAERTFEISLVSSVYAKAVHLELEGLVGKFSDNFFDLAPKGQKIVRCGLEHDVSLSDFQNAFKYQVYPYA
jgi:beta-mannosidase